MSVTEYDGVIINKLSLEQYKTLKANNQLVSTQTYVITDIDEHLDTALNNMQWQVRVGKIFIVGNIVCNNSVLNLSNMPLNTTLLIFKGQNNQEVSFKIVYQQNVYKYIIFIENTDYVEVIAQGQEMNSLVSTSTKDIITQAGYGDYLRIEYIHPTFLPIIDRVIRVNNDAF